MTLAPRVLLDGRKLGDSGIGVYIENLVDGLLELTENGEPALALTLLVAPHAKQQAQERWGERVAVVPISEKKYSIGEYVLLPFRYRSLINAHDLFHSPHYTLPLFLRIPSVVTIHDAIHFTHPETLKHRILSRLLIGSALARATATITVSEASAEVLRQFASGNSSMRTFVIPNALRANYLNYAGTSDEIVKQLKERGIEAGYLLFVGNGRPHKGLDDLLRAIHLLRTKGENSQYQLLVIGNRISQKTRMLVKELALTDAVKFYGPCSAEALETIYRGADCVVVPSRAEGFGLVALEAMAMGVPVVCSAAPSLKEVCGACAWYSRSFAPNDLAKAISAAHADRNATNEKVEMGLRRAREFTLAKAAALTLKVYRSVLEARSPNENGKGKSFNIERPLDYAAKRANVGGGAS